VENLGFLVREGNVSVPQPKVQAIKEFRRPLTKKNIHAFLGTVGYYRRFVHDFVDEPNP